MSEGPLFSAALQKVYCGAVGDKGAVAPILGRKKKVRFVPQYGRWSSAHRTRDGCTGVAGIRPCPLERVMTVLRAHYLTVQSLTKCYPGDRLPSGAFAALELTDKAIDVTVYGRDAFKQGPIRS